MKHIFFIVAIVVSNCTCAQIDTIYAKVIDANDYRYQYTPSDYQKDESGGWHIWSEPFEIENKKAYSDEDLTTCWSSDSALGTRLDFRPPLGVDCYCCGLDFFGVINVFNGNCSSLQEWLFHGRVKSFNFYWNDKLLCNVQLLDTWHFQYFDIGIYFKCPRLKRYIDAPYEYKKNDQLTFEIVEIFEGTSSTEICLSEFLYQGAPN